MNLDFYVIPCLEGYPRINAPLSILSIVFTLTRSFKELKNKGNILRLQMVKNRLGFSRKFLYLQNSEIGLRIAEFFTGYVEQISENFIQGGGGC